MDERTRAQAIELCHQAYRRQVEGELDEAITLYRRSLALCPTAEAHTFLGWTYSFQGRLDAAIAECKKAIAVDPSFGNPYNDIGAYYLQRGEVDEAIPWLEQAKSAARYEPRHFPFLNLGRAYVAKGQLGRALEEFRGALGIDPANALAKRACDEIAARLN
jgi:tetratricopeptide (TPR) repeat protein